MSKKLGNLDIVVEKTSEATAKKLAEDLSLYLDKAKKKRQNVLFLSSGGSALSVLRLIPSDILGDYLTVGILDERYDETNESNNFTQLSKTKFYKNAKDAGCSFVDTSVKKGQTQEELASYFEEELKEWTDKNPTGKIVATIGVGTDGHTSGMMPFPENPRRFSGLFESDRWIVAYNATDKNQFKKRVTTSITFLKMINDVFVLITGEGKVRAFLQMQKEGSLAEIPARILEKLNGSVYIDEVVLK